MVKLRLHSFDTNTIITFLITETAQEEERKCNECPTLAELIDIPVLDWFTLGLKLGLSSYNLDTIQEDYPRGNKACKRVMFHQWLKRDVDSSYKKLIYALEEMGEFKIASDLRKQYGEYELSLYYSVY